MAVDVALGMEVLRLGASDHLEYLWNQRPKQPALAHDVDSARGSALGHEHDHFLADSFGGDHFDHRSGTLHRYPGRPIDGKVQACRKARRTKNPQVILREAVVRISNRADDSGAQVAHPSDQIDEVAF